MQSLNQPLMSNSPTLGNISSYAGGTEEENPQGGVSRPIFGNRLRSGGGYGGGGYGGGHIQEEADTTLEAMPAQFVPPGPSSSNARSTEVVPPVGGGVSESTPTNEHATTAVDVEESRVGTSSANALANVSAKAPANATTGGEEIKNGMDKDGRFSVRLTPLIDHSSSSAGLYFSPVIRKIKPKNALNIGRYTEKNKAAAHAAQGSSAPIVFKSKVVSRTHASLECNDEGQWFLKDCKSSLGTFLNHIRLSPASQESMLMPVIDGDIIQLGMNYRGGTEEVYRCVKMRCEFNKSWQRKVNQFNLEIHRKFKNLHLNGDGVGESSDLSNGQGGAFVDASGDINNSHVNNNNNNSECAICLMKVEPCQALFISPCSHSWHYKCIRPIIIKSYPQFYCPNCRTMCDLETDLDDDDDDD